MDIQQGGIEFHICICIIKSRTFLVTAVFSTWDSDHAGTVDPFWSEGWSPPPCTPLPNWAINGSIKMARVRFLLVVGAIEQQHLIHYQWASLGLCNSVCHWVWNLPGKWRLDCMTKKGQGYWFCFPQVAEIADGGKIWVVLKQKQGKEGQR